MQSIIRIGTRDSELAIWQAEMVKGLLEENGQCAELKFIKSEGDINLQTPLYEMGVQGIFTKSLDIALLNDEIDIAVHSMKDVPIQLPKGIIQAAVIKRGNHKDLFILNPSFYQTNNNGSVTLNDRKNWKNEEQKEIAEYFLSLIINNKSFSEIELKDSLFPSLQIATSSIRRKAQWLNKFPSSAIDNIRGNVNKRLTKLAESDWHGAIFAAAGVERINKRPALSIDLNWMLPAPAQGAVLVVCKEDDLTLQNICKKFSDTDTELCTQIERDFLKTLMGGCSTPISALATINKNEVHFEGSILSIDGIEKCIIQKQISRNDAADLGRIMAEQLLQNGGTSIAEKNRHGQ